jgi:hypothetical protein
MADPQETTYKLASTGYDITGTTSQTFGSDTGRIYGRQMSSGNIRGNQNITGTLTIVNPSNNKPSVTLSGANQSLVFSNATSGNSVLSITGANQSITISDPKTSNNVITLSGPNQYILVTNPSTNINQIMMGKLPDGTYGLVVSKVGVDVTSVFS